MDYTDVGVWRKEIMFIKVNKCDSKDMEEVTRIAQVFHLQIVDYNRTNVLVESVHTEERNHDLATLFENTFNNRIKIVRSGSVGIEAISIISSE